MLMVTLEDQIDAPVNAPVWFCHRFKFAVPVASAAGPSISVVVNHGRWIARCPLCRGGAEHASEHDHRFLCGSCFNRSAGGQWLPTVWPANADAIEAVLVRRPDRDTRNWELNETVADLQAENAAHGIH